VKTLDRLYRVSRRTYHRDDKISVIREFGFIYQSDVMRAGAELVWSVCMLRKIWLKDMVRVSFDVLKKVVVRAVLNSSEMTGMQTQNVHRTQ